MTIHRAGIGIAALGLAALISGCTRAHGGSPVETIAISVHGKSPFATLRYLMAEGAISYDAIIARHADCTAPVQKHESLRQTTLHIPALGVGRYYVCVTMVLPGGMRRAARNNGLSFDIGAAVDSFENAASPLQPAEVHPFDNGLLVSEPFRSQIFFWNPLSSELEEFSLGKRMPPEEATALGFFRDPHSACVAEDGRLFVSDLYNNRVLMFPSVGASASGVLGQRDFTGIVPGTKRESLSSPRGLSCRFGKLVIVDSGNDRVLIWNTPPRTGASAPDVILGGSGEPSGRTLREPSAAYFDGRRLFVSDSGNHRILIWNQVPGSDGTAADVVLGQTDFTSAQANRGEAIGAGGLKSPGQLFSGGQKLFVVDRENHRVLVWLSRLETGTPADAVIGQISFHSGEPAPLPLGLNGPTGLTVNDGFLTVSDSRHHRMLRFPLDGAFDVKGEFVPPRSRFAIPGVPSGELFFR